MVLENMSLPEIKKQLIKDRHQLLGFSGEKVVSFYKEYVAAKKQARKKLKKLGTFKKGYWITSNRHNKWLVCVEPDPHLKGHCIVSFFCLTVTGRYPALITFDNAFDTMEVYTGHFLKRYDERLKLGLSTTEEKARHFAMRNPCVFMIKEETEIDAMVYHATGVLSNGIALGEQDEFDNIFLAKTFISESEYREANRQQAETAKEQVKKIVANAHLTQNHSIIASAESYARLFL